MKKGQIINSMFCCLLCIACTNNNRTIPMQAEAVFDDYTVKLPEEAVLVKELVKEYRWKIELPSDVFSSIIAYETSKTIPIKDYVETIFKMNDSDKFKQYLDSEKEENNSQFDIYVRNYRGRAGKSALAVSISSSYIIFDEINTQNRFVFELSSLMNDHAYIVDSIISSFTKISNESFIDNTINDNEDQADFQTFPSAGFKVKCDCKLFVNTTFIEMAKQQGGNNVIAAYACAENEDNPDIGAITNINIYDQSESYKNVPESGYRLFEEKYIEQYATNLKEAGVSFDLVTYQGVSAIEYTFDQMGLPTKAVVFLKNRKSYLLQVGTRNNLVAKYRSLKNSFVIL
ncbi:MAG: hypothetical protein EZS26_000227 [Candidatus Ordinivivax streblomastigis]|uniref:Uncharacterized protein n=1 Tax=Candidatus Ordinivivax streblomastigis TaxID=2540710 RepID=A0A5M8P5X5_9BACT|nr:MAG: hypothetical protein EZS26_000227 [Candidatus Ordinivivax streblomastigis]